MGSVNQSSWLQSVVTCSDGYESRAVQEFTERLIGLARTRLPDRLRRRLDPEDIVQSAFHSFFKRNREGKFQLESSSDIWRLLAAITYHKVMSAIEHHGRQRRNFSLDVGSEQAKSVDRTAREDVSASGIAMMTELLERILSDLPEAHQKILSLRLENYSIDEIAERVGVSSRTVDRSLKRIRKSAEALLNDS